jgi:hypothetical protein
MPQEPEYRHISSNRLRALSMANTEFLGIYREMRESGLFAPALLDRMRRIRALLGRADGCMDSEDVDQVDRILSADAKSSDD